MNKREYLRSLGFTVGERGRFNDIMKIELAKYDGVFDDDLKPLKLDNVGKFNKTKKERSKASEQVKHREARTLSGFTRDGHKVAFITCSNCHEHMIWCGCKEGIHSPSIVTHTNDSLVYVRKV